MNVFTTIIYIFSVLIIHTSSSNISVQEDGGVRNTQTGLASRSGQVVHYLPLNNGDKLQIRITLPENYNPNKKFPILLGPGLDGGNLNLGCRYFGEDAGQYGWILVESLVHMKVTEVMTELLDYLEEEYRVEGFHLLGFSANSVPQFKIAGKLSGRINSVTGMPGHPNYKDSRVLKEIKNIKVLMVVGEKDHWWKESAIKAEKRLNEFGLSVDLLVVPDGGHILDEFAGKPLFEQLEKLRNKP